jgi:hypothetical protein
VTVNPLSYYFGHEKYFQKLVEEMVALDRLPEEKNSIKRFSYDDQLGINWFNYYQNSSEYQRARPDRIEGLWVNACRTKKFFKNPRHITTQVHTEDLPKEQVERLYGNNDDLLNFANGYLSGIQKDAIISEISKRGGTVKGKRFSWKKGCNELKLDFFVDEIQPQSEYYKEDVKLPAKVRWIAYPTKRKLHIVYSMNEEPWMYSMVYHIDGMNLSPNSMAHVPGLSSG